MVVFLPKPFLALGKIITDDGNPTVIFLDVKIDLEVHWSFFSQPIFKDEVQIVFGLGFPLNLTSINGRS